MPIIELNREEPPDFSTHPLYRQFFDTLVTGGQNREEALGFLTELWRAQNIGNAANEQVDRLRPNQDDQGQDGPRSEHLSPRNSEQPEQPEQPPPPPHQPFQPPPHFDPEDQQGPNHQVVLNLDGVDSESTDARGPSFPPVDLEAMSNTLFL